MQISRNHRQQSHNVVPKIHLQPLVWLSSKKLPINHQPTSSSHHSFVGLHRISFGPDQNFAKHLLWPVTCLKFCSHIRQTGLCPNNGERCGRRHCRICGQPNKSDQSPRPAKSTEYFFSRSPRSFYPHSAQPREAAEAEQGSWCGMEAVHEEGLHGSR